VDLLKQPDRSHDRQGFERVAHRLSHTFQAIERADGGQKMGRIGALAPTRFQQPLRFKLVEHRLKEELLSSLGQQARPKLAQDREIKARISQLQVDRVFPVQAHPHRFCRLAVR
jgi:hypothetical protein